MLEQPRPHGQGSGFVDDSVFETHVADELAGLPGVVGSVIGELCRRMGT